MNILLKCKADALTERRSIHVRYVSTVDTVEILKAVGRKKTKATRIFD